MKNRIIFSLALLFVVLGLHAQKSEVYENSGIAINGYDPVAYFSEGRPVKGKETLSYSWNSATWHFASKEHLDQFAADPKKFAPQYGGYCAYGMSEGHKASTSPDAWTIIDGKLYLNYNLKVRELWTKDRAGNIVKADKNWPELKSRE